MKSTIRISTLALMIAFPLSGFATKCPAGTQGSSDFKEAQATLARFGEKLTSGVTVSGTWTQKLNQVANKVSVGLVGGKPEPAQASFSDNNGKLNITMIMDPGTKQESKLGPYETEVCSGGGKVTAVFLKTPMGDLTTPVTLDDPKGITLATALGDLNVSHLGGVE